MKTKWLSALIALLASANLALAQTPSGTITSSGSAGAYNLVAKTCTDGFFCYLQTDVNGQLKVTGSFSSSTTGFPTIQSTGTPISVTTGGVTGTLPTGAVVVASNVGTTNMAFCKLGASATTSDIPLAPNGGWFAFTVGVNTQLTCITSTSTTTVNMAGGSGLPTGTGGGGGSSGGSVTQGTSPWIVAGGGTAGSAATGVVTVQGIASMTPLLATATVNTWASGALGAMANYGTSPGAVLVPGVNAFITNTNANGRATPANSSPVVLPATPYETVAASQTGQALGATGGTGDYLSHCVIYPGTTSPGVVTVFDSTSSATNNVIAFTGGATSVSNLAPISIPVGAVSINGAWKVTTGSNVIVTCYGNFT